ncbi:hypothetical protein SAMN04487914_14315 [Arthrobacter sp. ok909]|nr:hypothetical protein SAMN04487914_14315 [Arthrobacter sp. ok909]
MRVEAVRDLVESGPIGGVDPGAGVAVTAAQPDFAGQEQLASAEELLAAVDPFSVVLVVSAPGRMDGPDVAMAESESGGSRVQDVCAVGTGAAFAVLAQVGAGPQRASLGDPFVVVVACEIQQLCGLRGNREGQHEIFEGVLLVVQVGQLCAAAQQAARE